MVPMRENAKSRITLKQGEIRAYRVRDFSPSAPVFLSLPEKPILSNSIPNLHEYRTQLAWKPDKRKRTFFLNTVIYSQNENNNKCSQNIFVDEMWNTRQ